MPSNTCRRTNAKLGIDAGMTFVLLLQKPDVSVIVKQKDICIYAHIHISRLGATRLVKIINSKEIIGINDVTSPDHSVASYAALLSRDC